MAQLEIDIALARRAFDLRVSLSLGSETLALVGPSGAGKSSLLRAVAGLERPTEGRITMGDQLWFDAARRVHRSPETRRVGYLPQDYGLFPHLSVAANVRFAAGRERPDLLERFGVGRLSRARPAELSGGERQRVALARALAREPQVLLLDEPFAALDTITRKRVRDDLAEILPTLRLPALLVTHSFSDATALAQRVGVIDEGRLIQLASADELLRRPASSLVAALGGANILAGVATASPSGSTVLLDGGGELASATHTEGPVRVALYPWQLQPTDPNGGALSDRVVSIRRDAGSLIIGLTRLTLHLPDGAGGGEQITEGSVLGLRADPRDVHVFSAL
jgi:molybdate transport system ATP-binding protein